MDTSSEQKPQEVAQSPKPSINKKSLLLLGGTGIFLTGILVGALLANNTTSNIEENVAPTQTVQAVPTITQIPSPTFYLLNGGAQTLKTYTNETFKFSFQYPDYYHSDGKELKTQARFETEGNSIYVNINQTPVKDYKHMDLSGEEYRIDMQTNRLVSKTDPKKTILPSTKTKSGIIAYVTYFGDAGCGGEINIIPVPDGNSVIELSHIICAPFDEKTGEFGEIIDDYPNDKLLSTFEFTK